MAQTLDEIVEEAIARTLPKNLINAGVEPDVFTAKLEKLMAEIEFDTPEEVLKYEARLHHFMAKPSKRFK